MKDKKRFDLAARTQKRIQEQNPYFRLIMRRDEIEKELKEEIDNHRYRIFYEKEQKEQ
jgi:hypothetical protein